MATSTYCGSTLLGNFTEEQSTAPPLNGVLPNYGPIDYSTTNKAELTRPQKSRQYRPERSNKQHRLITVEYIEEMAVASATTDPNARFADILANADPSKAPDTSGQWETSQSASFGAKPPRRGRRAAAIAQQNQLSAAAQKEKQPRGQAGAYGERLREDPNPSNDTRAQRSWVYGGASMFQENQKGSRKLPAAKAQATSLQIGGSSVGPATGSNARKSTSITKAGSTIPRRGGGVFAD
eukprot:INCI3765.1.p2 GENE.INCI3765.1~~INCI3765.1.p2  ORF type:complete len:238 (-),score=41.32 INCI3765.1:83-796(-)